MLALMKEKDEIKVVNDQRGSPTWTMDLSETIITFLRLVDEGKTIPYGIYHFTNEGEITWFDFAREIHIQARALGILTKDCKVTPCTSADFPAKVKRPRYSVLDKTKIKTNLGIAISFWNISLRKFLYA
jgi:dTDP-4-dehydrorhamnose reductase